MSTLTDGKRQQLFSRCPSTVKSREVYERSRAGGRVAGTRQAARHARPGVGRAVPMMSSNGRPVAVRLAAERAAIIARRCAADRQHRSRPHKNRFWFKGRRRSWRVGVPPNCSWRKPDRSAVWRCGLGTDGRPRVPRSQNLHTTCSPCEHSVYAIAGDCCRLTWSS